MARLRRWLPLILRTLIVVIVAIPAITKFADYAGQVEFFTSLGIPAPEVMVLVVGFVEVASIVMLALGTAGRVAALALSVVMLVAIVTDGANPLNVTVLLASLAIIYLGTGPYSLWQPEDRYVSQVS
ncbi:DoxX family protein [Haladaptatus sp. NG-SE-30]